MKKSRSTLLLRMLVLSLTFFALSTVNSLAQDASKSAAITEADKLKEKIASKVAEIEPVQQIITRGKVIKVDAKNKTFTFSSKEKTYEVTFPLKTQFFWIKNDTEKLSLNFANIEVDDELVILGDEIAGANQITAKVLYGKSFLKNIVGRVSAIDLKTRLITIKTLSSETTYTIDIASVINSMKMIKSHKETDMGIDQLTNNNTIVVKGVMKDANKNLLTAKSFYLIQN